MTDDKSHPNAKEQPKREKPEQVSQQAQRLKESVAASQSGQRMATGRKPLFGN
jgi:hypothetical protein